MAKLLGKFIKQPNEILDYDVDFSEWFENRTDAPASHTSSAETGLTIVSSQLSGNVVKVICSGGTDGGAYKVTVRLTTTAGLVKEVDFQVKIKEV
jgi:hypothetical protein